MAFPSPTRSGATPASRRSSQSLRELIGSERDDDHVQALVESGEDRSELAVAGHRIAVRHAVDADQDLATDDDRPSLFGQPFNGPMPGHGPGPIHYDLHAWIWSDNPSGEYAPFNASLSCG